MNLTECLQIVGDIERVLPRHELRCLSQLDAATVTLFASMWPRIADERRRDIVTELVALAEDNIDLDFRAVLLVCLDDLDKQVRAVALSGLWEDDRVSTLRRVLQMVHDPAEMVRAAVMLLLGRAAYRVELQELSPPESHAVCAALLNTAADPEQPVEVRRRAVEGAGYLCSSTEAQACIGMAYMYPDQLMRESAVVAMGRSMRPDWFPYIERELQSVSPALRYEAARAVGELAEEGRGLLPALLPLVDDDDAEVSLAAIWSLGQVGGPDARRVLQRLARSKDEARSQAAQDGLAEFTLDEV